MSVRCQIGTSGLTKTIVTAARPKQTAAATAIQPDDARRITAKPHNLLVLTRVFDQGRTLASSSPRRHLTHIFRASQLPQRFDHNG
mgnify:FL=1